MVPEKSPAEVYQHGRTPFLAAAVDEKSGDVTDLATFTWSFPDAKEPIVGNPAYYRFEKKGKFTVTVTATVEKDTGSDQIAVNVVEVVGAKDLPDEDDFELFMRVPGGDRLGAEVADTVEVVCRSLVDGLWPFVPFEWANTKFYQKVDGQWVFKGEDNPAIYEVGDNWSSYITWDTVGDPNAPIEWKAVTYLYDMMWPPGDPDHVFPEITAYFTPNNTVVKATGDEIILHEAEDVSHTIAWNITHSDDVDPAPEFTVTVTIYDLQGNVVDTLEEEEVGLGADSMNWDEDLPEEDGIYTYRIVANHQDMLPPQGPCEDRDKSAVLTPTVNNFYYCSKDVQAGTLTGVVRYTLNREAGSVDLRFYGPDLSQIGQLTGQPTSATTHWTGVYTLEDVEFDQNDDPIGPIYCVLSAAEGAADAAENRDGVAKPALQKGISQLTPVVADVTPSGPVMISTLHDEDYPLEQQTVDGQITVTAHFDKEWAGQTIYLAVFDPPDMSPYVSDPQNWETIWTDAAKWGDNADDPGVLSTTQATAVLVGEGQEQEAAVTAALTITDYAAGDTYVVAAQPGGPPSLQRAMQQFNGGAGHLLVAWKRVYIEEARMYRSGAYLQQSVIEGAESLVLKDEIENIGPGSQLHLFDAENRQGETVVVDPVNGTTVHLAAEVSADYSTLHEAAVGNLDPQVGLFAAEWALLPNAYGAEFDGSDGGCFVEFKHLAPTGGVAVPYHPCFEYIPNHVTRFESFWFQRSGEQNVLWVCAANRWDSYTAEALGKSLPSHNTCWVLVDAIEHDDDAQNLEAAIAEITAHEIGHQFDLYDHNENMQPPPVMNHDSSDACVMSYLGDIDNSICEFCTGCLNDVRTEPDGL